MESPHRRELLLEEALTSCSIVSPYGRRGLDKRRSFIDDSVRHDAPHNRVEMEGLHRWAVAAA